MKAIFVITTLLLIVAIVVIVKQQKKINAQAETIEYQSNKLNRREQYQHKAKQFIFHTKKK